MGEFSRQAGARNGYARGFTLTELLVALATVGLLAILLMPALAGVQPHSKSIQCLNNMRQLAVAWTLYAGDNSERLVSNSDLDSAVSGISKSQNWIAPSLGGQNVPVLNWTTSSANTNTLYLTVNSLFLGIRSTALISSYAGHSTTVFHCPADVYASAAQRRLGWAYRYRSCSMNGAMGDGAKYFSGVWPQFYNAKKMSDLINPNPAACFVILDEHPDSDNDTAFFVNPADASGNTTDETFEELPGSMHEQAAGINFADGHAELHRWNGTLTCPPVQYISYVQNVKTLGDPASLNDLTWLAQHTPAGP